MYGWRPTSVTVQPAHIVTSAATPANEAARRNQGEAVTSRRRHHSAANHAASASRAVRSFYSTSHARCTIVVGGRSAGGTASRPRTLVLVLHPERRDATPGSRR